MLYTRGVLLLCRLLKIRAKTLYHSDTSSAATAVLFIHEAFFVQLLVKPSSRTRGSDPFYSKRWLDHDSPRTGIILRLSLAINAVERAPQTQCLLTVPSLSLTNTHDARFGIAHASGGVLFLTLGAHAQRGLR